MKKNTRRALWISIPVLMLLILWLDTADANPTGGSVAQGSVTITHQPGYTQIQQSSDHAIINWQTFSIKANEHTHFQQLSSSSTTLNRINAANSAS